MSHNYSALAFTDHVVGSQIQYGSRAAAERVEQHQGRAGDSSSSWADAGETTKVPGDRSGEGMSSFRDPLSVAEQEFIADQDGFYMATVSESGWPYVQFRGGAPGFVRSPDEHTLAWADFRGNRQYISTGNLDHDPRVALIFLDYARQTRLKVFGVARVTDVHRRVAYTSRLAVPGYRARVERELHVDVVAYDWNCPQHITPRFSIEQIAPMTEPMRRRVSDLEAENQSLRARLASSTSDST